MIKEIAHTVVPLIVMILIVVGVFALHQEDSTTS